MKKLLKKFLLFLESKPKEGEMLRPTILVSPVPWVYFVLTTRPPILK